MKFLIQTVDNKIVHDFSFELLKAIEYHAWLGNNIEYVTCELNVITDNDYFNGSEYSSGYCPIGTVEFVCAYFEKTGVEMPKPINIPPCLNLFQYTNREVINLDKSFIETFFNGKIFDNNYFVKSNTKIKSEINKVYSKGDKIPEDEIMISELIDIDSEYRCFVFNNELVGIQNYSGDFKIFPDISKIEEIIKSYKNYSPIAYTLDVAISEGKTVIIECHDFFSCGLYGFSNPKILPYMYWRWFNEYKQSNHHYSNKEYDRIVESIPPEILTEVNELVKKMNEDNHPCFPSKIYIPGNKPRKRMATDLKYTTEKGND